MAGKKPINKTTSISIRLSESEREMIRQKASIAGLSVTDYLLKLVLADGKVN